MDEFLLKIGLNLFLNTNYTLLSLLLFSRYATGSLSTYKPIRKNL